MVYIDANKYNVLPIGRQMEEHATAVEYHYGAWKAEYGSGMVTAYHRRPGEAEAHPVVLEDCGGDRVRWVIGAEELINCGYGEWQLIYTVAEQDTNIRKASEIRKTLIEKSLPVTEEAPEPYESWIASILEAAAQMKVDIEETLSAYRTASAQDVIDAAKADKPAFDLISRAFRYLAELTKGQAWDTEKLTSPLYSGAVPSGAHLADVRKIGGKSIQWNQFAPSTTLNLSKAQESTRTASIAIESKGKVIGHTYYVRFEVFDSVNSGSDTFGVNSGSGNAVFMGEPISDGFKSKLFTPTSSANTYSFYISQSAGVDAAMSIRNISIIDLTMMFGTGNEPDITVIGSMLAEKYYPRSDGEIITADVTGIEAKKIDQTSDEKELPAALLTFLRSHGWGLSAGTVCNEIDLVNKKYIERVKSIDLGSLPSSAFGNQSDLKRFFITMPDKKNDGASTPQLDWILCGGGYTLSPSPMVDPAASKQNMTVANYASATLSRVYFVNLACENTTQFRAALDGVMLNYALETPVEYDISAYLEGEDFLIETEAGGEITFRQTDEDDYKLPVPHDTDLYINLSEATDL